VNVEPELLVRTGLSVVRQSVGSGPVELQLRMRTAQVWCNVASPGPEKVPVEIDGKI